MSELRCSVYRERRKSIVINLCQESSAINRYRLRGDDGWVIEKGPRNVWMWRILIWIEFVPMWLSAKRSAKPFGRSLTLSLKSIGKMSITLDLSGCAVQRKGWRSPSGVRQLCRWRQSRKCQLKSDRQSRIIGDFIQLSPRIVRRKSISY